MSVFDPDSIAYAKREAEIEEAWETAVEEAIATVADAYSDACASLEQHEADFTSAQITAGKLAIGNYFLREVVQKQELSE